MHENGGGALHGGPKMDMELLRIKWIWNCSGSKFTQFAAITNFSVLNSQHIFQQFYTM